MQYLETVFYRQIKKTHREKDDTRRLDDRQLKADLGQVKIWVKVKRGRGRRSKVRTDLDFACRACVSWQTDTITTRDLAPYVLIYADIL